MTAYWILLGRPKLSISRLPKFWPNTRLGDAFASSLESGCLLLRRTLEARNMKFDGLFFGLKCTASAIFLNDFFKDWFLLSLLLSLPGSSEINVQRNGKFWIQNSNHCLSRKYKGNPESSNRSIVSICTKKRYSAFRQSTLYLKYLST